MKTNLFAMLLGASMICGTGCVSYTGMSAADDELVDEANQPYAAAAAKAFIARKNAPARPVVIVEAPGVNMFLEGKTATHPLCQDLSVRKEMLLALKSQLRTRVSGLKDMKLVEDNGPAIAVVSEGEGAAPVNYKMTYNITGIEVKQNAGGSLGMGLTGKAIGGKAGKQVAQQNLWDGIAKVEIRFFDPTGTKTIFSFEGEGRATKMVDATQPVDKEVLFLALQAAANNAIAGYVTKFGPPIYVTDTCQSGRFARLSVGAEFGAQMNQRVEFYQNKVRKGATGEDEVARKVVGTGVIGGAKAPIEDDGAWVLVDPYDDKARTVFRWTSARILK